MAALQGFQAVVLALACSSVAQACLLPPKGCFAQICNKYAGFKIPGTGDFSQASTWNSNAQYDMLAFIRGSFNRNLAALGPGSTSAAQWLNLIYGPTYAGYGFGKLPALNYEFYEVTGNTVKSPATPVPGYSNPSASISACCHACRLTDGCPMYMYVPSSYTVNAVVTGTCYFVYGGSNTKDGPYDWTDPTNPKSPRTKLVTAPGALDKTDGTTRFNAGHSGLGYTPGPTYALVFLGGYCNNHHYSNGTVTDDPHFTGAHGTRFDFNGELNKAFCLVTDKTLHINAVLKGYKNDNTFGASVGSDGKAVRSWMKEVGIVWTDAQGQKHKLHLVARNGKSLAAGFLDRVSLDDTVVDVPHTPGESFKAGDVSLTFVGTKKASWTPIEKFQLTIGNQLDLSFAMRPAHPKLQAPNDVEVHFNLMFNDIKVTEAVHGVLGQTYRNTPSQLMKAVKYSELNRLMGEKPVKADGESGAGFLDGTVTDYEATNVLQTDCKVSTFSN